MSLHLLRLVLQNQAQRRLQRQRLTVSMALEKSPFCARGTGVIAEAEQRGLFLEGPHVALIQREEILVGVVSFKFNRGIIKVVQLQGIAGDRLFGFDFTDYLFAALESIRTVLNAREIWVQPAQRNRFYDYPNWYCEDRPDRERLQSHQKRLRVRYDQACEKRGFRQPTWHCRWWRKQVSLRR